MQTISTLVFVIGFVFLTGLEGHTIEKETLQAEMLIERVISEAEPKTTAAHTKVDEVQTNLNGLLDRISEIRDELETTRVRFDVLKNEFSLERTCFFEQGVPGLFWPSHPSANKDDCISIKGVSSKSCPKAPRCGPGLEIRASGTDQMGCSLYECTDQFCPAEPKCQSGQKLTKRLKWGQCPAYKCEAAKKCPSKPNCEGEIYKYSLRGCTRYICITGSNCPARPVCSKKENETLVLKVEGVRVQCLNWRCQKNFTPKTTSSPNTSSSCPKKPTCPSGSTLKQGEKSSNGCTAWSCEKTACPKSPTCKSGEKLEVNGTTASGCLRYVCESSKGTVTGAD